MPQHGGGRPAQPGGPHRVAGVMRSAQQLRDAEGDAADPHRRQPATRRFRGGAAQGEPATEQAERSRRVSRRKASAGPPVVQGQRPVRNIAGRAAEFDQVPWATDRAAVLQRRDQQQAGQRGRAPPPAGQRQHRSRKTPGSHDVHEHDSDRQRTEPPTAIVEDTGQQPVVAPGEAMGLAEPANDREVGTTGIPREHKPEERQRPQRIASQRRRLQGFHAQTLEDSAEAALNRPRPRPPRGRSTARPLNRAWRAA